MQPYQKSHTNGKSRPPVNTDLLDSVSRPVTQAEIDAVYEADEKALATRAAAAAAEPVDAAAKRRQFRRLDETWAERLLSGPHTPPWIRLAIVLMAEADFHRRIRITRVIEKEARISRNQKRGALEHLERQGFISVEWRGQGRAPVATPLRLTGRPERK
jgi:hypothetical protein